MTTYLSPAMIDHLAQRGEYTKVTIEQLDAQGNVYRTFVRHTRDLNETLDSIERAYNMAHTRITIER